MTDTLNPEAFNYSNTGYEIKTDDSPPIGFYNDADKFLQQKWYTNHGPLLGL